MTAGAQNFNNSSSQKCLQISKIIQSGGDSFYEDIPGTPTIVRTDDDTVRSDAELKILLKVGMTLHALVALDEILMLGYLMFSPSWVLKNIFP